jgi:predicted TIM-barrel fold metal-dependent hydrolase|tara:strand:+ start:1421 stop:2350 length:930 start_codon:yes stop_codon:yes gene_type:complete
MHEKPIIDTFLHGPWIGTDSNIESRADRVEWIDDPRLKRVMKTFKHDQSEDKKPPHISIEQLLDALEHSGVERAILATKVYYPAPADDVIKLNHEFARLAAGTDSRLRWIASLIPPELGGSSYWDVMQNTRLIDTFSADKNLSGIHITPSPWGILPNDKWFFPVYTKCVEYDIPVFTYVGAPGPLWPMAPNNPEHLDAVALAFPDLKIVAHHIGDPWTEMSVRLAARHENFYICTSAWSPKAYPESLKSFLAGKWHGVRGCDKVIFASDFPLLNLETVTRQAREIDLDEEKLEKFLYANADKLFWQKQT